MTSLTPEQRKLLREALELAQRSRRWSVVPEFDAALALLDSLEQPQTDTPYPATGSGQARTTETPPAHADNAPLGFTGSERSAWSVGVEHGMALRSPDDGKLWCVNVQGPDDVYAAPDHVSALESANELNVHFGAQVHHELDPIMRAVVIEWPHSAESHADALAQAGNGVAGQAPQDKPAVRMWDAFPASPVPTLDLKNLDEPKYAPEFLEV